MPLDNGFLPGLLLEDAAEGINVFAGDGLKNDAVAFLHKDDTRAGLDAEPTPDARPNDPPAIECDAGGVFESVAQPPSPVPTGEGELICSTITQGSPAPVFAWLRHGKPTPG